MKKFILFTLLLFASVQFTRAAVESVIERREGNQLVVSGTPLFTIYDNKYTQMATDPTWGSVFTNYKVNNVLRLGLNPDVPQTDDLSGSITFTLKIWTWNAGASSFDISTETGRVLSLLYSYSNPTDIVDEISSYAFNDAHKVEVYITSITGATFDVEDVFVSAEIDVERYYSLNNTTVTGLSIGTDPDNAEYYQFDWNNKLGAEFYELEWVHISDATLEDGVYKTSSALKYNYYLNSTRILVKGNSYRIPKIFDHGYLLYRIRPVGLVGTTFSIRKEGTWTTTAESGTVASHTAANREPITTDYDEHMNWSHQVAYGDNGERFESVSFADGLGRGRQSVGHNTETQQAVVSNVYYDELGRPVISDLPTPEDGEVLRHKDNFNLADENPGDPYQQEYFDSELSVDVCNPLGGGFSTTSGAGKYYSSSNPDQDGENIRIPDAANFPFSRVTYRNDFTGRVDKVSGVGADLKMGSGKETSFAYPSPNQAELDMLFGAEVGKASHYEKMVTIDANGQIYVQYSDMAGRVIASFMAGEEPNGMDTIDGNGVVTATIGLLPENDQTINNVLPSSTLTYNEFIYQDGTYIFDYAFTPQQFQDACMQEEVCLDCVYDFTMSIVGKCNDSIFHYGESFLGADLDKLCEEKDPFTYTSDGLFLEKGEYTIIKTLKVNQQAIADNWCYYIDNATCLEPLSDLFNEEYTQETFPFCSVEVSMEGEGECDSRRAIMLNDLSPGGQYGLFVNTAGVFTPLTLSSSVHSMLTEDALGTNMDWKHPATPYLNADLSTALINGAAPELASFQDFVTHFQPSWAKSLITYHPEYCFLEFCDSNALSNEYDQDMLNTNTFDDACAAGFFKPLSASQNISPLTCSGATNYDPFFQSGGDGFGEYSSMLADMDDYMGTGFSIWEWAIYEAYCNGEGKIADCLNDFIEKNDDCYNDLIWIKFREMYLALKQQKVNSIVYGLCENDKIGVHPNWINNVSVWGNPDALPDADGNGFPEDGTGLTQVEFEAYMDAQVADHCLASCEDYADDWLIALEGCEQLGMLSGPDLISLRNDLIALCMDGCDSDHPMGASTSVSGQTIDDVLLTYFGSGYEDELCTGLLISSPAPYQSPAELEGLIIKPLDTCACNVILTAQYDIDNEINNPNDYNLEQLIASRTGVSLEDAHYLICACDLELAVGDPYNPETTVWLESAPAALEATGITIPAGLACSGGNGCVDCVVVGELMTTLGDRFDGVDDFENTANYPVILTNYLNSELHFTLNYYDYIEFLAKCNADAREPYCTVNPLVYEWLKVIKLLAFRGMLLRPDNDPVDLMAENIVFANGKWKDVLNGNNYWSEVPGNYLVMHFGEEETNCYFRLTLPEDPDFGFEDIVSFGQFVPTSATCEGPNTEFTVTASYYKCGILTTAILVGSSDCFNLTECVCGPEGLTLCDKIPEPETVCYQPRLDEMYQNALTAYDHNIEELYDSYIVNYKAACAAAFATETFEYTGPQNTYQYTLFFYDQAGNLVRTIAPEGIDPAFVQTNVDAARNSVNSYTDFDAVSTFSPSPFPDHSFVTAYTYNSYNQLAATANPDQIDSTKFWYDFYGRMVASQNPVQAADLQYSYVLYDEQGRPVEVGQMDRNVPPIGGGSPSLAPALSETSHLKVDDQGAAFKNWVYLGYQTEVTFTVYDEPMDPAIEALFATGTQQNLRLRVASVVYFDEHTTSTMPVTGYVSATHYSYDLHGNVIEMLQDVPAMAPVDQDIKSTQYDFELLSGNVKKVEYQKGQRDRMTHEYIYDKLYRLAEVLTSTDDGIHKSREAHYRYFDYGPLARVETGQHKVQGNDYTYTINGWLKGMNSTTVDRLHDAGSDGALGYYTANPDAHALVARDVTGYMMGYFPGDYTSIGSTDFEAVVASGNDFGDAIKPLYNGNIVYTTTGINGFETQGAAYAYDQLQRLKQMRVFRSTTLNTDNDWSNSMETPEYSSSYTYDRNGNLKTLVRKATTASGAIDMDDFAYEYVLGSNRLTYVDDNASANAIAEDIEPGQTGTTGVDINGVHTSDNYEYDKLGQLVSDDQEDLTMIWRDGDKKLKLQKGLTKQLEFVYNPFGQRVYKVQKAVNSGTVQGQGTIPWVYTYYAYDANGQLMATYDVTMNDHDPSDAINIAKNTEQLIYGSGRIGVIKQDKVIYTNQMSLAPEGPEWTNHLGEKNYELTNHLGNVNVVITDRKMPNTINTAYTAFPFTTGVDGWAAGANASVGASGGLLNVTTTPGSNNSAFKIMTTVVGETYTVRVKADKGTASDLKLFLFGISSTTLVDGEMNTISFTATSTSTALIVQPLLTAGSYTFSIDYVGFTSGSIYEPVAIMKADYYPFGMQMPEGRSWQTDEYRFGYNGMEKDPEMKGEGNSYTTEFRQYDPRLGRWASLDPLKGRFPDQSPYSAFNGNPVLYNDPTGESGEITITQPQGDKPGVVRCTMDFYLYGSGVSGLLEAGISNQDLTDQMLSALGNVKTIKVNGVDYEVVWDVQVSYILDDATAREMTLGSVEHPMVLDASQNYLRIESSNKAQKERGDADEWLAKALGNNQGNVSEMTEVDGQIGSNTGFLILSEIIKDKTVLPHEGIHNVGLKHGDTDYSATEPDLMTSPGQPVTNVVHSEQSFPNMKKEFVKSDGGIDVIDVVNKRVFTQDNFIDALEKNGFTVNNDRTGIEVDFGGNREFTRDFGKPDNTYYNAEGRMTTPVQDRGGR